MKSEIARLRLVARLGRMQPAASDLSTALIGEKNRSVSNDCVMTEREPMRRITRAFAFDGLYRPSDPESVAAKQGSSSKLLGQLPASLFSFRLALALAR